MEKQIHFVISSQQTRCWAESWYAFRNAPRQPWPSGANGPEAWLPQGAAILPAKHWDGCLFSLRLSRGCKQLCLCAEWEETNLKEGFTHIKKAPKILPHLWEHNPQKKTTFQQITFSLLWGIQSKQAPQIQSDFSSPTELDSFINWDINAANSSLCLSFPKNTRSVLSRWEQICMAAVHQDTAAHLALPFTPSSLSTATQSTLPYRSCCLSTLSTVKALAKNAVTVALGPLSRRPVNLLCNF